MAGIAGQSHHQTMVGALFDVSALKKGRYLRTGPWSLRSWNYLLYCGSFSISILPSFYVFAGKGQYYLLQ